MRIIAGPCQIESVEQGVKIAEHCKDICDALGYDYYFKASFDKANRSHAMGKRGLGFVLGTGAIRDVAEKANVKTCVDFHDIRQIKTVFKWGKVPDIIQIPAFLCRQTDLIKEAMYTGAIVNIKKGQFLAPWDVSGILSKTGMERVLITERGTCFGYNNLVADMRSIPIMQKFGYPIVFDATHSAQLPGGNGIDTSGMRDIIPTLARSAVAAGCNGLFMEVHNNVENAKSDASTQWPLEELRALLISIKAIRESII